jgi:hypothetical protein
LLTEGLVTIHGIQLLVEQKLENDAGVVPIPIAYAREKGHKYYPLRIQPFSYNPYKQNPAIKLQKDLSYIVNSIHGHEITYFRVAPKTRTRDVIFLEWSMYEYDEPKCTKVLVPRNEFPDNKFNFTTWGADFEIPFEVHVDKRYWEWIHGRNTSPQKRDAIYFPLTNRMYRVDSSQLVKDFMQEGVYYKLSLVKWVDSSNIQKSDTVKNLLDDITLGIDKAFGEEIIAEEEKITNLQQTVDKTSNYDPIRMYINPNEFIVQETFANFHTTILQYHYDLFQLYQDLNQYTTAVKYKPTVDFPVNRNRTYTCWFREPVFTNFTIKKVNSVSVDNNIVTIRFKYGLPKIAVGQWLELTDTANSNWGIFGEVISIEPDRARFEVQMVVPDAILQIAQSSYPDWINKTTLEGKQIPKRNFLYGYVPITNVYNLYGVSGTGIMIDIFKNDILRVVLNNDTYWFPISPTILSNIWYGMVINMSNQFNQLGVHIWRTKPAAERTTLMTNTYTNIIDGLPNLDYSADVQYEIQSSCLNLSNIRLMNEPIELEKQTIFLNQNIIKDAHLGIIIDNAIPRLKLPYMGAVK